MRTTLSIDDDVLEVARCMAEAQNIALGAAISYLARRGIPEIELKMADDGFLIFDVPDDFPKLTVEDVRRELADFP
jgi:hypothetical protein